MADRPIIFSAPMVRALLDGRKSQTRRVLKHGWAPEHRIASLPDGPNAGLRVIPCEAGDRLWVREAWADLTNTHGVPWEKFNPKTQRYERGTERFVWHRADGEKPDVGDGRVSDQPWRPSIHMPRWASRLTLNVTEVRVQRLQEISEADAVAEGALLPWTGSAGSGCDDTRTARSEFEALWNSLHGPDAWAANPWVCAISFTVERRNIDEAKP